MTRIPVFWALSQAVSNLLSNALKFSPPGSVIFVSGSVDPLGTVEICVKDRGPGIEKEAQTRVFDRYWQPLESRHAGSGLGLYIVRGVARAHGGDAMIESEPGKGSRFCLRFPSGLDSRVDFLSAG